MKKINSALGGNGNRQGECNSPRKNWFARILMNSPSSIVARNCIYLECESTMALCRMLI